MAGEPGPTPPPGSPEEVGHPGPAASPRGRRRLWTRLGLRARVTLLFGLGALVLSASMGGLSYFTARHFLVSERQNASIHQAYLNAKLLRATLHGATGIVPLLAAADSGTAGSNSLLYEGTTGKWYVRSIAVGQEALPASLRHLVLSGTPATQTFQVGSDPAIAVGVPIPSIDAAYFEVFDVSDLRGTLRVLALALFGAGLATTVLGAAVGRSAAGRSLRPLTGVSKAAMAIASGQLETRLPAAIDDPDLAGLTGSFNAMVDQLQERIEREERFSSDVSHELRSPLTTLSTTLTVLEAHRDELPPPAQRALELLGADLRRFQRMVGDLLEISRSDTGSVDVALEGVTLGELVRRSVAANSRTRPGGAPTPDLEVDPAVAQAWVTVDKRRFERVMANLLENATLYGGGATAVRALAGPHDAGGRATVRVSVEDHGPGVAASERTRVFERFYRGQTSGQRGTGHGTGLGLALVAEHVRLQGGRVWADEVAGGGARFTIELPVSDEADW
jgi:two-component system, OmpR family, sensor histidine kinase MtrB